MIWLKRFLMLILISMVAYSSWMYGKTGDLMLLGCGILVLLLTTASVCLFAETRYDEGYVAGMKWLKNLWGK